MTKPLTKRVILKQRLYSFKVQPKRSVDDHLDDFNCIILELENIDIKVADKHQAIILLNSQPEKYEHFADTMMYSHDAFKLENVVTTLTSKS